MKEGRNGSKSTPVLLDIDDFKGDFSFDALFGNLVNALLPSFQEEETDQSPETHDGGGHSRTPSDAAAAKQGGGGLAASPLFPEVDALLNLFKDSYRELIDLRQQVDSKLLDMKKEVSVQDSKHRKTLSELEKGVDGLFNSFARLDSRISSVGQTAAQIGDHLQII